MELMTNQQQLAKVQSNQGYFKMEDTPSHEEYMKAIDHAFDVAIAEHNANNQ